MKMPLSRAVLAGLLVLSPIALATSAHAADDPTAPTPANPYIPPAQKQLSPKDIQITRGPGPRQLTFATKQGSPLALILVTTSEDGRVRITSPGTDFTQPSTWRQMGFGDLCWRTTPPSPEVFVLPEPTLPFVGPPGTWQFSNVIVSTSQGPVVYNKPLPNEYVTGQGSSMESLVACVVPAGTDAPRQSLRIDDLPTAGISAAPSRVPAAPSAVASPLPLAPPVTPVTPELVPATPEPGTSSTPPPAGGNDKKVTICHATTSVDNPYTLITVSVNSIAKSGHLQHTGPLYPQVGWGDVIPPIDGVTPGVNWPAGQGMLENGCVPVAPPIDPWPPIEPPEPPVKPQNPIITVPPPLQPIKPPIATLAPSPTSSATETPSSTPEASQIPTSTPSGSPESSGTPEATPSSTPEPTGTPEVSSSPSDTPSPSSSPSSTLTDRDLRDSLDKYCETKDEADLPAGVKDSRTTAYLTNGVSTLKFERAYSGLYCASRSLPATTGPDTESLADTGGGPTAPLVAGLLLLSAAVVLAPIARRR